MRAPSTYLESVRPIWGVLWGLPSVELSVAAEKKPLQFTANGRAMTAAVVLYRGQHPATLGVPGPIKKAKTERQKVGSEEQQVQIWTLVLFCGGLGVGALKPSGTQWGGAKMAS